MEKIKQYDGRIRSVSEMLGRPENDPTCQRYNNGRCVSHLLAHPRTTTESIVMMVAHCVNYNINEDNLARLSSSHKKDPHLFDRNERLVFHIEHFDRGNVQSVPSDDWRLWYRPYDYRLEPCHHEQS